MQALANHIAGARYVELADAAHLAPAEQRDVIADELHTSTQRSPL
jgi:hypothetical protein